MEHKIRVNRGTDGNMISIEAYIVITRERTWYNWLFGADDYECVARIDKSGEWYKPGWRFVIRQLWAKLKNG